MFENCFIASFLIVLLSAIACVAWNAAIHVKRLSKHSVVNPMSVFSVCTFFAFLLLFIPNAFLKYNKNLFIAILSALFDTIDSLSFGNTIFEMLKRFFENVSAEMKIQYIYVFYACVITLMVPVLTTRAVFMIFRDVFTQGRYSLSPKKVFHIFSELNNKSITIARDISEKDKDAKIIFTGINKKTTDNLYIEQARKINALLTNKTLNSFNLKTVFPGKRLYLYFVNKDRIFNVNSALDKYEALKDSKAETTIYVFSTDFTDEKIIDIANSRKINPNVRLELFNAAQRIAYNLMYEHPVYEATGKDNHINVMIIGAGNIGLEIAKAAAWCSQMTSRTFSVKIFDKDKKNEKADFPFRGLKEKLSKIGTLIDLEFIECDIFSDRFDALRFERADYIVIDLGEDSVNLHAALLMREIYARQKTADAYAPSEIPASKIITIIKDEEAKKNVKALKDPAIIPFGSMHDVFCVDNISNWKIDKAGEFLHASYACFDVIKKAPYASFDCIELFNDGINNYSTQSELNKRSSRAVAIHSKYKFCDIGFDMKTDHLFSENSNKLFENTNLSMLRCEHDRWNIFQMLDGWEAWDKNRLPKGYHKDAQAKLHAYLAEFDELKDIAQYIYADDRNPVEFDQVMVIASRFAIDYAENGYPSREKLEKFFDALKECARKK